MNQNNYVFISYTSADRQTGDLFRALLGEQGIACWMAPYDIPAGSRYAFAINDALENCACLLLLLTDGAQQSQFVEREVERAVTYRKPILTVQLEEMTLNSGFKFYLGSSQIITMYRPSRQSPQLPLLLDSLRRLTGSGAVPRPAAPSPRRRNCEITVFSPVNTRVFLEDRDHPLLSIDRNSGFDYRTATTPVPAEFTLLFSARGFEKAVRFETPDDRALQYNLNALLTREEVLASYSREEALARLADGPTAYAFEQLAAVGREEDLPVVLDQLNRLSADMAANDAAANYRLARAAEALGRLALRYRAFDCAETLDALYAAFPAKSAYGYMILPALEALRAKRSGAEQAAGAEP